MRITKAAPGQFREVRAFYHSLIDALEGKPYHPMWEKDIYPAPDQLRRAVEGQTLYLGYDGARIAAAMALDHQSNEAYETVSWPERLEPQEYLVIHMLGVHGDFAGRGYARELVGFAVDRARSLGMKAVRLDVLEGNLPAERLYEGFGFSYVDTVPMFYEDTGWTAFKLYEYRLGEQGEEKP